MPASGTYTTTAQQALDALRQSWGTAYDFHWNGMYHAIPKDGSPPLRAVAPDELASQLARDMRLR
jgi:hypothetical protein